MAFRMPISNGSCPTLSPSLTSNPCSPATATPAGSVIDGALERRHRAYDLLTQLVWPTMELLQTLYREDRISISSLNLATRLNRSMTDQLCARLPASRANGKKVLIFCGNDEPEELGGQICADLFEADGWTVRFAGGGVPDDEVLKLIGEFRPDLLVMFGTLPSGVPAVRKLIDYLREVNSCPEMQVMCCGGIYKRAEGLAEEIGADLYAPDAARPWRSPTSTRPAGRRSISRRSAAPAASARPPPARARPGRGPRGRRSGRTTTRCRARRRKRWLTA